jgi:hypothetical protein
LDQAGAPRSAKPVTREIERTGVGAGNAIDPLPRAAP